MIPENGGRDSSPTYFVEFNKRYYDGYRNHLIGDRMFVNSIEYKKIKDYVIVIKVYDNGVFIRKKKNEHTSVK